MSHVAALGLEPAAIPAAPTAIATPFTRAYTRYAMGLLLAIYIVNFLDRQVVNILAEPIKNDLGLADWQLGLMSGLAFAVFYTFLGIPIARLAERRHRPIIIGASVAAWSGFTALCGAAQNFTQLVACRIGVGVGEAGCTPPAHSLIVDYVLKEKRASALAFYSMGTPLGGLVGMIMGGLVADAYGWRAAFLVAGVPGILFALLVLTTLEEPRRLMARHAAHVKAATPSFGERPRGGSCCRTPSRNPPTTARSQRSSPASSNVTSKSIGQFCFDIRRKTQPSRLDIGNEHIHAPSRTSLPTDTITALWISRSGGPLTYDSVRRAITETTRVIIGVPVSPHLFRAAGATSAALHAPQSPHLASALLQHSDPRVTEEHYNRASSLSVALDFTTLVRDL
jgi:Major Facilitator Superfamily